MKKVLTPLIIVLLPIFIAACSKNELQLERQENLPLNSDLSAEEQLKLMLLSLGDNATISSDEDMEALWNYLNNNSSMGGIDKFKWKLTEDSYLVISGGRSLLKLIEDDNVTIFKFVTTIDCPAHIGEKDISFITEAGTYTNSNSSRWLLGKETEAETLK